MAESLRGSVTVPDACTIYDSCPHQLMYGALRSSFHSPDP